VYEETVDGWRIVAYKDGSRVRLISRNAVDHTARSRELAAAVAKLRPDILVLDGEVAVFDERLVSRFHLLGEPDPTVPCTPPMFIAFDVLQVGRQDVRPLPLKRRRSILEDAIAGSEMVLPVRRLEPDGARAWATVERRGLEGFVAKDPASTYRTGPTRSWVKVKQRHEGVFLVGGIRNVDAFDGVLVGEVVEGRLHYRGVVEWGYKAADVLAVLQCANDHPLRTSPFVDPPRMRSAVWMERAYGPRSATRRSWRNGYGRRRGAAWFSRNPISGWLRVSSPRALAASPRPPRSKRPGGGRSGHAEPSGSRNLS
jgi:bifunctional non-homologous end joining protein LigD